MTPARRSGRNQAAGRKPTTRSLTLPQQRHDPPPASPQPTDTPSAAEDEEEDEDDEEVEESSDGGSVTRCLCGEQHNVGLMVQCDKCEVWQHCDCVGLTEQEMPELYYCDHCQPDNHVVYKAHGRYKRAYNPNGSKRNSTDSTNAHTNGATDKQEEADTRATKRRKREPTTRRQPTTNKRKQPSTPSPMATRTQKPHEDDEEPDDPEEEKEQTSDEPTHTDEKRARRKSNDDQESPVQEEASPPVSRGRKQTKSGGRRNQHGSPQRQTNGKHKDSPRLSTPLLADDVPAPATPQLYWDEEGQPARESSPPAKVKYPNPKMSIADMNKRAKQIMDYVNRLQIDLGKKKDVPKRRARSDSASSSSSTLSSASTLPLVEDDDLAANHTVVNKYSLGALTSPTTPIPVVAVQQETTMDIVNHITRDLVHFQRKFGNSYSMVSSPRVKKLCRH
ncbi:hypothetical protein BJV82DRAFT_627617 [Fennellomyces sp. T-0311]|nr:hypothetical protein BJV82DRAFT_627617 [Fennellomyces sp. T-0311]